MAVFLKQENIKQKHYRLLAKILPKMQAKSICVCLGETMTEKKNIKFFGNQNQRDEALRFVDQIMKESMDFRGYSEISQGLDALSQAYRIRVMDDDDSFSVSMENLSAHVDALEFVIEKSTGNVYRINVNTDDDRGDDADIDFLDGI